MRHQRHCYEEIQCTRTSANSFQPRTCIALSWRHRPTRQIAPEYAPNDVVPYEVDRGSWVRTLLRTFCERTEISRSNEGLCRSSHKSLDVYNRRCKIASVCCYFYLVIYILERDLDDANQARELFKSQGISVAAWAREHGFPIGLVYRILRGEAKCLRGTSHAIAVALGLKAPLSGEQRERLNSMGIRVSAPVKQDRHTL